MLNLNEKQEQAILLLAQGKMCQEIAETLNVTPKTISTWRADPEFRAALNQYLENIKAAHSERLRCLCGLALKTIEDSLNDEGLSPKDRLAASFKVLELCKVEPVKPGLTNASKLARYDALMNSL